MTTNYGLGCRGLWAVLVLGVAMAEGSASAATITLVPVPGQRTNFPEGPQASVMFTIINGNQDPMTMTSAAAAITNLVAGDGFDVASAAAAAQNQCPSIAAFNPKTGVAGQCNVTVTFSTTDLFKSDPETPGDLVTWNLALQVTARSLTHPSNPVQTASSNLTVGVFDTSLPEPSSLTLFAGGIFLLAAGARRRSRRQH